MRVDRRWWLPLALYPLVGVACSRHPSPRRGPLRDVAVPRSTDAASPPPRWEDNVLVAVPPSELPSCAWAGLGGPSPLPSELRPLRCGPIEWFVGGCLMHCNGREAWRAPGQRCMDPCGVWLHHVGRRCWMGLGVYPGRINLRFERGRVIATGVSRNGGQIALDEEFLCRAGYPFEGAEPARE